MLPSLIDWPDLEPDRFRDLTGTPLKLAVLDKGTASGQPVVTLRIDPPPASEADAGHRTAISAGRGAHLGEMAAPDGGDMKFSLQFEGLAPHWHTELAEMNKELETCRTFREACVIVNCAMIAARLCLAGRQNLDAEDTPRFIQCLITHVRSMAVIETYSHLYNGLCNFPLDSTVSPLAQAMKNAVPQTVVNHNARLVELQQAFNAMAMGNIMMVEPPAPLCVEDLRK
jgi:hypothetical protein